jgi:hypothetical protein
VLGERLSRQPLAFEGFDQGRGRRAFRGQLVLGPVGLGVLQLHFQLIDESLLALRARAIERAPKLFDLQTQPRDQRVGAGGGCLRMNQIGRSACRTLFALKPRGPQRGSAHVPPQESASRRQSPRGSNVRFARTCT